MKKISRREFLSLTGLTAGAAVLAACTTPTPVVVTQVVTQLVNQTSVVKETSIVKETQVVQVTPTPLPAIVTPQGRTLPPDAAPLDKQILYGEAPGERKHFDYVRDIYYAYGMNTLSEPLVHNDQNFVVVPALAESWKAGPETRYWEFVIRKDAVWSDGTPVTADDVVFTWAHAANPAMANSLIWFYAPIKGVSEVSAGGPATLITDPKTGGVRKMDDRTVRFYGAGASADGDPCPFMLGLLSYQAACTIPKHIAEKDELHWADNLPQISCGPYLCTDWTHNVSMTWDINPKYTGPNKPGIQKLSQIIPPATGSNPLANWLAQTEDALTSLSAAQLAVIRSNPKLNPLLHFFSNFESQYISLNTFVKPLDNLKLRQALAHAIDRETLCNQVLNGTFTAGYTMLPPGFPAYNKKTEALQAYDVAAAQQLLADAGYKDGKDASGKQLTLEITDQNNDPRSTFIKQQWETNLGIKVNIKEVEAGTWGTLRGKHGMPIFNAQYEYDFIDPANMLTGLFHSNADSAKTNNTPVEQWGSPRHGWYNADFDKLIDQAGTETDVAKRMAQYQAAEVIQCTEAGQIFITHQVIFQVWWPWIVGVPVDNTGNQVWRYLDITSFQVYIHKDVDALKAQYKGIA
jgi:oligopeptide transport system substrate-binding protein